MSTTFDRRLTPARREVAALHLKGQVEAERFVEGTRRFVLAASAPLRPEPRPDRGIDTELVRGEVFTVYDQDQEGWSWGQAERDGYVGWLPSEALGYGEVRAPTHTVAVLRTFLYPGPDMKLPMLAALPFGVRLPVREIRGDYAILDDGAVWAAHLAPVGRQEVDFVAVAERFLGVPYLWGGRTSLGLDCSALVQTALEAVGHAAPRDTDMQESALGVAVDPDGPLRRGDLVFWRGHVGIMQDATMLLHANGWSMTVLSELFGPARARILGSTGKDVTSVRRIMG